MAPNPALRPLLLRALLRSSGIVLGALAVVSCQTAARTASQAATQAMGEARLLGSSVAATASDAAAISSRVILAPALGEARDPGAAAPRRTMADVTGPHKFRNAELLRAKNGFAAKSALLRQRTGPQASSAFVEARERMRARPNFAGSALRRSGLEDPNRPSPVADRGQPVHPVLGGVLPGFVNPD